MRILGIDLGTTNSLISYFDENGPHIIPNRLGDHLTPSIVSASEDGEVFVGKIAAERLITHPNRTVANFKRHMGVNQRFTLGDQTFLPEELSSFIIRSLVEDAEVYLNEKISEVVISVPAYFNDVQRKATKHAGELAGLTVERIINEPTAAAIAYGLQEEKDQTKFLVIDLGGGTFDVSILELYQNIMEVRGVAGDNFLGGEDFTEVILTLFLTKNHFAIEQLTRKEKAIARGQAELVKRALSDMSTATMKCLVNGESIETEITGLEFEEACKPLLRRLRQPIERALSDAAIKLNQIEHIVLVGGATKSPIVKRFVSKLFKKFPSSSIDPDEVVACGAAIQGAMKARNEQIKEIILTDVCPYTLGTDIAYERDDGSFDSGHFKPIIERNITIPVSKMDTFYTIHNNQCNVKIDVLQGESRFTKNNILLGELNVAVPARPAGKEAVDVRFTYDINGILEVEVTVVSTGTTSRAVIEQNPGYLSETEIEKRLMELKEIKIHPREQEENKLLIARGERMYEEHTGDVRQYILSCLRQFEVVLDKQDFKIAKEAAKELAAQLDQVTDDWL